MALDATAVQERLGSPEGELAIAEAVVYLACAAKSNAIYKAFNAATALAKESGSAEVPMTLRNAPTVLLKDEGYGEDTGTRTMSPVRLRQVPSIFQTALPLSSSMSPQIEG